MEGFKPILDSLDESYGALEEPSPQTNLDVAISDDKYIEADAVGYDENGTMLHAFQWITFEEEDIERLEEDDTIETDDIPTEEVIGETMLVQTDLVNLDDVVHIHSNAIERLKGKAEELSNSGPKRLM